jgi:hypothetical protein
MHQAFGAELARIRVEALQNEAGRGSRRDAPRRAPGALRRAIGLRLITAGGRLAGLTPAAVRARVAARPPVRTDTDRWLVWRRVEPDAEYLRAARG